MFIIIFSSNLSIAELTTHINICKLTKTTGLSTQAILIRVSIHDMSKYFINFNSICPGIITIQSPFLPPKPNMLSPLKDYTYKLTLLRNYQFVPRYYSTDTRQLAVLFYVYATRKTQTMLLIKTKFLLLVKLNTIYKYQIRGKVKLFCQSKVMAGIPCPHPVKHLVSNTNIMRNDILQGWSPL